jgi:hypothetical protein
VNDIDLEMLWRLAPESQTWPDAENVTPVTEELTEDVQQFLSSLDYSDVPLLIRAVMWASQGAIIGGLISALIHAWRWIF